MAAIDRARHHLESTPVFAIEYLPHPQFSPNRRHGLEITLEGPEPLDAIEFSFPIQRHDDLRPTGFVDGKQSAEEIGVDGPIAVGTCWLVWLSFDEDAPHGDVRLLATCRRRDEEWTVVSGIHVTPTPQHRQIH